MHPLSPVPLSHRCPIHSPQTGVATCSKLFHLIRGHKLLPHSLYTVTEKREERERERERERMKEGKPDVLFLSRSVNYSAPLFSFSSTRPILPLPLSLSFCPPLSSSVPLRSSSVFQSLDFTRREELISMQRKRAEMLAV